MLDLAKGLWGWFVMIIRWQDRTLPLDYYYSFCGWDLNHKSSHTDNLWKNVYTTITAEIILIFIVWKGFKSQTKCVCVILTWFPVLDNVHLWSVAYHYTCGVLPTCSLGDRSSGNCPWCCCNRGHTLHFSCCTRRHLQIRWQYSQHDGRKNGIMGCAQH